MVCQNCKLNSFLQTYYIGSYSEISVQVRAVSILSSSGILTYKYCVSELLANTNSYRLTQKCTFFSAHPVFYYKRLIVTTFLVSISYFNTVKYTIELLLRTTKRDFSFFFSKLPSDSFYRFQHGGLKLTGK